MAYIQSPVCWQRYIIMTCKAPLPQLSADKAPAVELVSQLLTAAPTTLLDAGLLSMLWWLTAEEALQVLKCLFRPRATTTGSPVTTKWCGSAAALVRSFFKSTIPIRSALPAFIRLTKPIRHACLTVSNTCSNAQSWNLEYDEVFQRVFQSLTGTAQKTNTSTRSISRDPQLFLPMVIWTEQHSEQPCEC